MKNFVDTKVMVKPTISIPWKLLGVWHIFNLLIYLMYLCVYVRMCVHVYLLPCLMQAHNYTDWCIYHVWIDLTKCKLSYAQQLEFPGCLSCGLFFSLARWGWYIWWINRLRITWFTCWSVTGTMLMIDCIIRHCSCF